MEGREGELGDDWDREREGWEAVIEGWGGSDRGLKGKQLRNNLSCPFRSN